VTTFASRFFARRAARAGAGLLAAAAFVWFAGAAAADVQCVGDCNGDGTVSINELVVGVNIALGIQPPSGCVALQDASGQVNISQLIKSVNNALGSCPIVATPTVTTASSTPTPTGATSPSKTPTIITGPSETPTPTSTPEDTNTPGGAAVCGNGIIEPGETCDDGNTLDDFNPPHDTCPANCVIHACQVTTSMLNVDVLVQLPAGVTAGALQSFLRYPDGVVSIPGTGSDARLSIINLPPDAFGPTFNDLDYAVRVEAVGPGGLTLGDAPPNRFFTAQFTLCQGANTPAASDFYCTVETAATVDGADITSTTTCSVSVP
jgi:cysteine-rich repeat protein